MTMVNGRIILIRILLPFLLFNNNHFDEIFSDIRPSATETSISIYQTTNQMIFFQNSHTDMECQFKVSRKLARSLAAGIGKETRK